VPPLMFLALVLALTAATMVASLAVRCRRMSLLRRLCRQWSMNYSPRDPFNLTPKIAASFPVPGAADLNVVDVVYRQEPHWYRYLLTVEYTQGVLRAQRRRRWAVSLSEQRDPLHGNAPTILTPAPQHLSLLQQYAWLHDRL